MKLSTMPMRMVANLSHELQFVSDSQEVEAIREMYPNAQEYDAFFVRVGDGEYTEIWGIVGIVPYNSKLTSRIV